MLLSLRLVYDLEKAFDKVSWPKLFRIIKNNGIRYKGGRIISILYRDQKEVVEMLGVRGEPSIRKRVRQGCFLSSITIFRFANDIALLANTERKLKEVFNVTDSVFIKYNVKMNIGNIEIIPCRTKSDKKRLNIKIGNGKIGEISEFRYLESKITRDGRYNIGIRSRIG